jgi:hypothetical protein
MATSPYGAVSRKGFHAGDLEVLGRKSLKVWFRGTALGLYLPAGAWNNCGEDHRCMARPNTSPVRDGCSSGGGFMVQRCWGAPLLGTARAELFPTFGRYEREPGGCRTCDAGGGPGRAPCGDVRQHPLPGEDHGSADPRVGGRQPGLPGPVVVDFRLKGLLGPVSKVIKKSV